MSCMCRLDESPVLVRCPRCEWELPRGLCKALLRVEDAPVQVCSVAGEFVGASSLQICQTAAVQHEIRESDTM